MFPIEGQILAFGTILLLATVSSRVSTRFGVPLLVVFVLLGMSMGSEGPGRIDFADYELAHGVGTVALILILFDGGLLTSMDSIRRTIGPSGLLATVGVLVTAAIVGVLASYALAIPLSSGLLLGSIVASTDAAAVFAALRSGGLHLRPRLASTLEIESGSNDPMAVLLTVACLQFIQGDMEGPGSVFVFFGLQLVVGALVGWLVGHAAVRIIAWIRLPASGFYPIVSLAAALVSFGAAAVSGGSGFLAVYITGIVLGNRRLVFERGIRLFHDGLAWLAQIAMFAMLGLLSFPSQLRDVWASGLLFAAILVFVARPLAVALCVLPFRYGAREILFLSWAGLKGAVPIILGIYPLLFGIEEATGIFHLVFFVVLVSAAIQGWSLGPVARRLGVISAAPHEPPVTVEVSSLKEIDADIVSYLVSPHARAANRRLSELGLTAEMVVAMIVRDGELLVPKGSTFILPGDHVFVTLRRSARWLLDHVFSPTGSPLMPEPMPGGLTLAQLRSTRGLPLVGDPQETLAEFIRGRLGRRPEPGDAVHVGMLRFVVLDVDAHGAARDVRLDLGAARAQGPAGASPSPH